MRLINTSSLEFQDFTGDNIPYYGILSHTWGEEEVLYHQWSIFPPKHLKGFNKIDACCTEAKKYGLHWVWVDTCCIDKSSSAELSEAINSMYEWYKEAVICYVYLCDVKKAPDRDFKSTDEDWEDVEYAAFHTSRWFTRGWTLQELLAPQQLRFYDEDWTYIGSKDSMLTLLSRITRIETEHLNSAREASVAQKMSWASNRSTTRQEDIAYCMLGLFDVNMPLLYGEGKKAFIRLQHQIIQSCPDESIFAWKSEEVCDSLMF